MSGSTAALRPDVGDRGLASSDPAQLADLLGAAWSAAADFVERVPLDLPSRVPDATAREVLVPAGSWDEHERFVGLLDDVRHDRVHEVDDPDARTALLIASHADADGAQLAAALHRAGDVVTAFLRSEHAGTLGREQTASALGPLPVGCVLAAATYDLAVRCLDVAPPDDVPDALAHAAVGALVDVTAALAARQGLEVAFGVRTPRTTWVASTAPEGDWTTIHLGAGDPADVAWPMVEGTAADVLDAAAGRRAPVPLLVSRRLRLRDVPGLLAVLPALDAVRALPGGAALQAAARTVARTGQALSRLSAYAGR